MGHDRHPIRALGSFHYQDICISVILSENGQLESPDFDTIHAKESMGNIYKTKAKRLKGDPYTGVCFQALETLERLCLIQTRVNY